MFQQGYQLFLQLFSLIVKDSSYETISYLFIYRTYPKVLLTQYTSGIDSSILILDVFRLFTGFTFTCDISESVTVRDALTSSCPSSFKLVSRLFPCSHSRHSSFPLPSPFNIFIPQSQRVSVGHVRPQYQSILTSVRVFLRSTRILIVIQNAQKNHQHSLRATYQSKIRAVEPEICSSPFRPGKKFILLSGSSICLAA